MKQSIDPKQFGNQKNLSIQHYLVQMMHRILSSVDSSTKGEAMANLCSLIDWKSAYSFQCHKLGIESFIRNKVRPSLIPLLINYFQGREMRVKFHGQISKTRKQPGSGAQGPWARGPAWETMNSSVRLMTMLTVSQRLIGSNSWMISPVWRSSTFSALG